jgi:hypothetical protein
LQQKIETNSYQGNTSCHDDRRPDGGFRHRYISSSSTAYIRWIIPDNSIVSNVASLERGQVSHVRRKEDPMHMDLISGTLSRSALFTSVRNQVHMHRVYLLFLSSTVINA